MIDIEIWIISNTSYKELNKCKDRAKIFIDKKKQKESVTYIPTEQELKEAVENATEKPKSLPLIGEFYYVFEFKSIRDFYEYLFNKENVNLNFTV